jgi:hypothetical protein
MLYASGREVHHQPRALSSAIMTVNPPMNPRVATSGVPPRIATSQAIGRQRAGEREDVATPPARA